MKPNKTKKQIEKNEQKGKRKKNKKNWKKKQDKKNPETIALAGTSPQDRTPIGPSLKLSP